MATPYVSGQALTQSYMALSMNPLARAKGVYMTNTDYNKIMQLTDLFSSAEPALNYKVERSTVGNTTISMDVNTSTAAGTSLVLTSSDPNFFSVRVNDYVQCTTTYTKAFVTSVAPGTITVTPVSGTFAAGDYAAGTYLSVWGDISLGENSTPKTSINVIPDTIYNVLALHKDNCTISRRAFATATYELYDGKYWAYAQEKEMVTRFARTLENFCLNDTRIDGGVSGKSVSGGLLWYAKNYGQYVTSTSATITQSVLNGLCEMLRDNVATGTKEYAVLCGTRALRDVQENVFQAMVTTAGTNTILGGKLGHGIDFDQWNALGITLKFIHYPAFNDPNLWQNDISAATGQLKASSYMLFLPIGKIATSQGMVSPYKKHYMGNKEFIYTYQTGTVGVNGGDQNTGSQGGYIFTSNSADEVSVQIQSDCCTELVARDNILFYQLIA